MFKTNRHTEKTTLFSLFSLMCGILQACYGILKVPEGSWLCRTAPGCSAHVFAVSQERRSEEAHPQWDQVGARAVRLIPEVGTLLGGSASRARGCSFPHGGSSLIKLAGLIVAVEEHDACEFLLFHLTLSLRHAVACLRCVRL